LTGYDEAHGKLREGDPLIAALDFQAPAAAE
jgi:hypothetical protein